MMGRRHATCVRRFDRTLQRALGDYALISVRTPIAIPDDDEPEPDIAVLRPRDVDYEHGHPMPPDVLLFIEVSDTTLAYDRGMKLGIYARAGIPDTWIVDLPGDGVERHAEPDAASGTYRTVVQRFYRGGTIRSTVLPGFALPVEEVPSMPPDVE